LSAELLAGAVKRAGPSAGAVQYFASSILPSSSQLSSTTYTSGLSVHAVAHGVQCGARSGVSVHVAK